MPSFDAIVLAGGRARRLAGVDKALLEVGDATLLDRALAAVRAARTIVVVGPRRDAHARDDAGDHVNDDAGASSTAGVVFTREDPPGAGPAAAIAHALTFVDNPIVVIVAVDAPFAASAIDRLLASLPVRASDGVARDEAAMLVDEAGRRQPLIAAYVAAALRGRAEAGPVEAVGWANRSVRDLVEGLRVIEVPAVGPEALDCDTPEDLGRARRFASPPEP